MDTDLIILGGGPAGCAAAIHAQQLGLNAIVVEPRQRIHRQPGETLHPGVEPLFEQLGVMEEILKGGFRRHAGIWTEHLDGTRHLTRYGESNHQLWRGFQISREKLLLILRQAAKKEGAEFALGARPQHLIRSGNKIVGVNTSLGCLTGHWVLDATGRTGWLSKQLGIATKKFSNDKTVLYGWRRSPQSDQLTEPVFTQTETGWRWVAQIEDREQAWVCCQDHGENGDNSRLPGLDVTWQLRKSCAGPGYFIAGDAAAILDPSSSHGIIRAMMGGVYCAFLCRAVIDNKISDTLAENEFQSWVCGQFLHDVAHLSEL